MLEPLLAVAVLILSVVIHENAHGWTALALGDLTARESGRLTLNPIKHLDPIGSVIMPLFMAFTNLPVFGYAKPVPVNARRLKGGDRGFAIVALAGPVSNLVLAFLTQVLVRATAPEGLTLTLLAIGFQLNLFLAAFNLLPIPPLDGSRLLRLVLRPNGINVLDRIEPFGFVILLLLMTMLPQPLFRAVDLIRSALQQLLPG